MSEKNLRLVLGLVILVHGIGHSMGVLASINYFSTDSWHGRSWLLSPLIGGSAARVIGIVLFGAITACFLLCGLSYLSWGLPADLWKPLALYGSIASMIAIFMYWNSFSAFFNKAGALLVNVGLLYGLLANKLS